MTGLRGRWPTSATRCQTKRLAMSCGASALRAPGVGREAFKGELKILTSCPSCLQGLSRFSDDAGTAADYIVVEMAKRILVRTGSKNTSRVPIAAASSACSSETRAAYAGLRTPENA